MPPAASLSVFWKVAMGFLLTMHCSGLSQSMSHSPCGAPKGKTETVKCAQSADFEKLNKIKKSLYSVSTRSRMCIINMPFICPGVAKMWWFDCLKSLYMIQTDAGSHALMTLWLCFVLIVDQWFWHLCVCVCVCVCVCASMHVCICVI